MPDKRGKPALAAALCGLLAACGGDLPEDRIRTAIDRMEAAVEARKAADFLDHVSDDFAGQHGTVEKRTLRGYLASLLLGNQLVEVTRAPATITMHGAERATVTFTALVIGGERLPERGEHLTIRSGWRLEDGEWRVYVAEWQ